MTPWIAWGLAVIALLFFLYWLIITTEGVYLGRRMVVWLYDLTAHKYHALKEFDADAEQFFIARPLLLALAGRRDPLVLDVATGSGRVPLTLLPERAFNGRIIGLDASGKMLAQAAQRLKLYGHRIMLIRQTAVPLPFPNQTFDAVTCLEALEFFPSDEAALCEMVRVLQPGGFLMTSRRIGWEGKVFLHRYRTAAQLEGLLHRLGLEQVQFHLWQEGYELVTAVKPE